MSSKIENSRRKDESRPVCMDLHIRKLPIVIPEPTARSAVRGCSFRTAIYTRENESISEVWSSSMIAGVGDHS
jgi:hypothetical protein